MKYIWVLWLLASCASSPPQEILRTQVLKSNFDGARATLEKSELKLKERNEFLYLLEKGQIEFVAKDYKAAIMAWEKARELLKSYYKKKLGDKVLAGIANSNVEDFHGEIFEQHQFFFHLSLAYLRLSNQKDVESRDRVRYLASARAAVLDWDSFIKGLERNGIKAFYQESFLGRFYASLLHEMIDSREDLQIAFQLMKDAKKLVKFDKDFKVLAPGINEHMGRSLVRLAKKLGRKKEIKSYSKEYNINANKINLYPAIFIIDTGLIAAKKPTKVPFGLEYALNNPSSDVRGNLLNIGMTVLSGFSYGVLGLGYQSHKYNNPNYVRYRYRVTGSAIDFEVPVRLQNTDMTVETPVELTLVSDKQDKLLIKPELIFSLSELSRAAIDHDFEDIYFRTGLRASMKYLVAIVSAYKLYRSMTKKQVKKGQITTGDGWARLATSASFALAAAAISASEKADTRYWSTLPDRLLFEEIDLKSGTYEVQYKDREITQIEKKSQALELFSLSIRNL